MYEWEEKLRIAYEVFYIGNQYLTTNEKVRDYWVIGISGEYRFKYFSVFLNLENFWTPVNQNGKICILEQFKIHNLGKSIRQQTDLY